jgi:hypothetical protein
MAPYRLILDSAGWEGLGDRLRDPFLARIAATNRQALDALRPMPRGRVLPRRLDDPSSAVIAVPTRVDKIRLARGAVAWWLERRRDDADDLVATVDHLLADDWGVDPSSLGNGLKRFDLRTGEIAWNAAFACDVLAEVIGPDRVARLQRRLAEELLPSYLAGVAEQEWWSACDFNWACGTHAQAGFAALAIAEDHPAIAARALAAARTGLVPLVEAFPAGGAWVEGMMYQTTTLAHLMDFAAALWRCTGDDLGLAGLPAFGDCLRHRQEQLGGDGRPFNFSNCNEHSLEWWLPQAYWWARRSADPALTAFADRTVKPWWDMCGLFHDVESMWYREAGQAAAPRPTRGFHHFAGLDWTRWEGHGWWLALRGGRLGGNHGNADLGQLILGSGSRRWLVDPGYGAAATHQHSLPTIRGQGQTDRARAPIVRRMAGDDLHLAIDLREAHPFVLDRWVRHILVLDGRAVVLVDDLLGNEARRLSARFQLQVRGDVSLVPGGAELRQEGERLRIAVGGAPALAASPWSWADQPLTTLSWRPWPDTCALVQAVAFQRDDAEFAVEHDAGGTGIRVGDRRWRLDRQRLHLERVPG